VPPQHGTGGRERGDRDEREGQPGVGPPRGTEDRTGQPEHGHPRLVRRVPEEPIAHRQRGDVRAVQVRGTGVQQPRTGALDHDHLFLRAVTGAGRPLDRLDQQRHQGHREPGTGGEPAPGACTSQPATGPGELHEHDQRGREVPEDREPTPRTVRLQRRRHRRDRREGGRQPVQREVAEQRSAHWATPPREILSRG
jgi:hypothetical protein